MAYTYDSENIFAKILRGEIPNDTVLETDHTLSFRDIAPQAPVHVLVICKGAYVNFDHFMAAASEEEIVDFNRAIAQVTGRLGLNPDEGHDGTGYRIISNSGAHGMQDVPHLHVHILGGRRLGRLIEPAD
jgi:histidine triad (HIT) family protein